MLLRSTVHPPCTDDQEVLEVSVPTNRKELTLANRLSLRLGLWLLLRTDRSRRKSTRTITQEQMMLLLENRRTMERESLAMLTHTLQRFPR
ncbi:hypothetical protein [Microbacterium sp.]|uniref:hypothetical protein n=1 Tax=Microbacterium sp. TaxID=51671 RepID=UPI003F99D42B